MTHGQVAKEKIVSKENAKWVKTFNWKDKRSLLILSFIPDHSDDFKATEKIQEIEVKCRNFNQSSTKIQQKRRRHVWSSFHLPFCSQENKKKWNKKGLKLLTGTSVGDAWIFLRQNEAKCSCYTSFQRVTCGKPKKSTLQKFRLTLGQSMCNKCTY